MSSPSPTPEPHPLPEPQSGSDTKSLSTRSSSRSLPTPFFAVAHYSRTDRHAPFRRTADSSSSGSISIRLAIAAAAAGGIYHYFPNVLSAGLRCLGIFVLVWVGLWAVMALLKPMVKVLFYAAVLWVVWRGFEWWGFELPVEVVLRVAGKALGQRVGGCLGWCLEEMMGAGVGNVADGGVSGEM